MTSPRQENMEEEEEDELSQIKKRMDELDRKKKLAALQKEKEREEEEKRKQEEEAEKARQIEELTKSGASDADKQNNCSIFVGKLHPRVTKEQLEEHFKCCGTILKCTIPANPYTHLPKGYAYLMFADESCVENALQLDRTLLGSQEIEVKPKRENKPNMSRSRSPRRRFRRRG